MEIESDIWGQFDKLMIRENIQSSNHKDNHVCINIERNATIVCIECGLVSDTQIISYEPETSYYNNGDDGSFKSNPDRCGAPIDPLFPNNSLNTCISGNTKLSVLHVWQSQSSEEKILYNIKKYISNIIIRYNIPDRIINDSLYIYKDFYKTIDNKIHRGAVRTGFISVCVYYACNNENNRYYLSSTKICEMFNINNIIFSKCMKFFNENVKYIPNNNYVYNVSDFVSNYCNTLKLSFNIQKLCKNIIDAISKLDLLPKSNPNSIISSIIYFINIEMNISINIEKISLVCNTSIFTIQKNYNIILKNKKQIFNIIKNNLK